MVLLVAAEYRAGRRLSTDHAYVLVHAFELINLVGVRDGAEAFDALSALEAAYGSVYPWMLHDLERWIEDLALVHGLEHRLLARWDAKIGDWTSRHVSMRLLARHIGDGFLRMPMPVIGSLAKYDVDSTFARAGNQHLFEHFVRLSLERVDEAFRRRTGSGLVERFAPSRSSSAAWRPHAFYGAVYAGEQIELEPVADHRYAEQLADRLHGVVKYTDLRLRDEVKFKHRLRSVKITKTDAKIVDRLIAEQLPPYLQRFGQAKTGVKIAASAPVPEPVQVTVDSGRIRELIGESDATRTLLIEAMEGAGGGEPVRREPVAPPTSTLSSGVGFDAPQMEALQALLDAADPDAALRTIAAGAGMLPEMLLDAINEVGLHVLGDTVVDLSGGTPRVHAEYVEKVRAVVDG